MRKKNWLSGLLAAAFCVNALSVGAFAAESAAPRSTGTQTVSAEETVYVNSYSGSDRSILFDDNWKFNLGEATGAENTVYNDSTWRTVSLPHDYSIEQAYTQSGEGESGYLPGGTGWYRKSFTVSQDWANKRVSIDFGGVYMNATVYLNGVQLGTHPYGYTPFSFELPADKLRYDRENVLAVKVENQLPSSRWYSGSGIYRSVHLTVTNPVHVARYGTTITTTNEGAVTVKTNVENNAAEDKTVTVKNTVYKLDAMNTPVATSTSTQATAVAAGAQTEVTDTTVSVNNPALWAPDAPHLYVLRTEVLVDGTIVDTVDTEFGFREFSFDAATGFSLNGVNMKLKGMCMHHDQGALGSEAWYRATERQVEILQGMGCNAIRVTHNPASDELIEICNRKGMLVIDEAFDTWTNPKNGNGNDFSKWFNVQIGSSNAIVGGKPDMTWAEFDIKAMAQRDKNAPCVIMYSLGNEIFEGISGNTNTYPTIAQNLIKWLKEVDTTRLPTFGDNQRTTNQDTNPGKVGKIINDAGGIVGFNYANTDQIQAGYNYGWKMYGSETASAVNSRGVYDRKASNGDGGKGDYKLTSYDKSAVGWGATASDAWWRTITQDFNAGEFVWTGFDYIGEPTPWNGTAPGAQGSWPSPKSSYFGVVDTNGLPKDSYYFYQSQWRDDVTTLHVLPTWDEADVLKDGNNVEVVVYSDAPVVKLYLNGTEVGTATSTETTTIAEYKYRTFTTGTGNYVQKSGHQGMYATFNVGYATGTLTAKAYQANGTTEITDTVGRASVSTTKGASKLTASADRAEITADGRDLSYVTIDVTDADGKIVNGAENEITVKVTGNGTLVGLDNGVQADHTSYQSNKRKAGAGQLVAIVQSTKQAGTVTVTSSANGLTAASVSVTTTPVETSGSAEKRIVSYQLSKNYYVKLHNAPVLPTQVTATYSNGSTADLNVTWETPADAQLETVGSFPLRGSIGNTGLTATVNINMLDEVEALLNYSAAIPVGGQLSLPSSRPAVMADGKVLDAEFPVTWEMEGKNFNTAGTVVVPGTASVFGKQITVTASIRVAEGEVVVGGNVAPQAAELTQDAVTAANPSDTLEAIRNGATEIDPNTSGGPNPSAWSNYDSMMKGNTTSTLTFRYDTAQNLGQAILYFFTDSWATALPKSVAFAWSGNGTEWSPIEAQQIGKDTSPSANVTKRTYTFGAVPAVYFRVTFENADGKYADNKPNHCTGLTELELNVVTNSFTTNDSAALTGLTVNGIAADAASLAAKRYPTQALLAKELTVESSHNASYTVLPAKDNVIKILTESEDHSARDVYAIELGADTTGTPLPANDGSKDYTYSNVTVSVASEQTPASGNEGPKNFANDNNENTFWHSQWNQDLRNEAGKRYIQLELQGVTTLSALRYKPRPTVANGIVTEYRVEVSTDGITFTSVASGTWAHDTEWKLAQFNAPVNAKYVKLYGVQTKGGAGDNPNQFMSAAEVRVRVADAALPSIADATVTVNKSYDWTGTAIVPAPEDVTVTLDNKVLTYGVDYKLRAENNTNVGTATLYVDGIVGYSGTASTTFTINSVDASITGFEPLDTVTTLNGVAPVLPEKVTATMSAGPDTEQSVTWESIDASKYTDPAAKTFTVEGTVAGTNLKPSVTVKVIKGTSLDKVSLLTAVGVIPALPETCTVHFDDNSTQEMNVTWEEIKAEQVAGVGNVTVTGTVTAGKDTLNVTANVRVAAGKPTGNLALNQQGSGFPMALAYVSAGNNNPYQALNGVNGAGVNDRWSDWESGKYHTDSKAWLAVALVGTSTPAAAQNASVTLEKQFLNKAVIHFVDEDGTTSGAVTFPQDYEVQYYTGPDTLTLDTRFSNQDENWGNGRVRALGDTHPLNVAENWTTVSYKGSKPAVQQNNDALTVEFDTVNTSLLRILCTPKTNKWTGVSGFEVYGLDLSADLSSNFLVTSIQLDGKDRLNDFVEYKLEVELSAEDTIPQISATATNNAAITYEQATSKTGAAKVTFTSEDGQKTETYTVQFSEASVTPLDKTALEKAITTATDAKSGVATSDEDASEVAQGTKFVTTDVMNALEKAITAAEEAKTNADTQNTIDEAATALNEAVKTFTNAIQTGIKTEPIPEPIVTSVTVSPDAATVQKGETQTFTAIVTGDHKPAQTVTWSLEEDHVAGTDINADGLLTVAADETAETLTVKATSTVDSSKSATATVTVTTEEVTRYTLTVNDGSGSGDYEAGAKVTITAETRENERFEKWTAEGIELDDATENPITITMPAKAVTLTATYMDVYAVTVLNDRNGTATASPAIAAQGDSVTLTATANGGYQFKKWQVTSGGASLSNANAATTTFTMPGAAVTVKAVFEQSTTPPTPTTYTVTFDANGGSVTPASAQTGEDGKLPSLPTPTRSGSYRFDGWYTAADGGTQITLETVFTDNTVIYAHWTYTGGSSSGGSHTSDTTTTTTTTQPDGGKVTTTVNKTTGETTVATTSPDGVKSEVKTDKNGGQTATVTLPSGSTGKVELPMPEMKPESSVDKAPSVTIKTDKPATVVIPVKNGSDTVVAVVENKDGTETILTKSVMGEDGLIVPLDGTTTFKLVDNAKEFIDVPAGNWAENAVDFVTSRELFQGTSAQHFSPEQQMNRGMLVTVLWRLENKPEGTGDRFADVADGDYFAKAVQWASSKGIVTGTGANSYDPEGQITREQLAAILYRYAGSPAVVGDLPYRFTDRGEVSGWAADAMSWAIQNDIISGKAAQTIAPQDSATRAEVAVMLQRFATRF